MKTFITTLISFLILTSMSVGQKDTTYHETLNKMFKVMETEEIYKSIIVPLVDEYRMNYPDVEQEKWKKIEQKFIKISYQELVKALVPVYKKYLTLSDLEKLITFFETPTGKKYAQSSAQIMQESSKVGQEWGMQMEERFEELLQEEGLTE